MRLEASLEAPGLLKAIDVTPDGSALAFGVGDSGIDGDRNGYARVYTFDNKTSWVQQGPTIMSPSQAQLGGNRYEQFGRSISIGLDGSRIIVGAPLFDNPNEAQFDDHGIAYIFGYDNGDGATWLTEASITGFPRSEAGFSVSMDKKLGTFVAFGLPKYDWVSGASVRLNAGLLAVFELTDPATGEWTQFELPVVETFPEIDSFQGTVTEIAVSDNIGIVVANNKRHDGGITKIWTNTTVSFLPWDDVDIPFGRTSQEIISLYLDGETVAILEDNSAGVSRYSPESGSWVQLGSLISGSFTDAALYNGGNSIALSRRTSNDLGQVAFYTYDEDLQKWEQEKPVVRAALAGADVASVGDYIAISDDGSVLVTTTELASANVLVFAISSDPNCVESKTTLSPTNPPPTPDPPTPAPPTPSNPPPADPAPTDAPDAPTPVPPTPANPAPTDAPTSGSFTMTAVSSILATSIAAAAVSWF